MDWGEQDLIWRRFWIEAVRDIVKKGVKEGVRLGVGAAEGEFLLLFLLALAMRRRACDSFNTRMMKPSFVPPVPRSFRNTPSSWWRGTRFDNRSTIRTREVTIMIRRGK